MSKMQSTLTAILINGRLWDMKDEQSGEQRAGTTLNVSIPISSEKESKYYVGSDIQKLTGSNLLFDQIDRKLFGQQVDILCDLEPSKQGFKAVPVSVTKAKIPF